MRVRGLRPAAGVARQRTPGAGREARGGRRAERPRRRLAAAGVARQRAPDAGRRAAETPGSSRGGAARAHLASPGAFLTLHYSTRTNSLTTSVFTRTPVLPTHESRMSILSEHDHETENRTTHGTPLFRANVLEGQEVRRAPRDLPLVQDYWLTLTGSAEGLPTYNTPRAQSIGLGTHTLHWDRSTRAMTRASQLAATPLPHPDPRPRSTWTWTWTWTWT